LAVLALTLGLVAFLSSCGGQSADQTAGTNAAPTTTPETPPSDTPPTDAAAAGGTIAAGEAIYKQRCVLCHGTEGKGDGVGAAGLDPKPRNHTDGTYMNAQSDEALLAVISAGKGQMPAWGQVLTEQQMKDVLAYVRTLAK
jgi:mono/diheme cytochrome c family protein